jgi:tetraprenyl-beta-curcumene synthase
VIRRDAIAAHDEKRVLVDGAALFWTLPMRRRPELLRLLVAFQTLANYLDNASERAAAAGDAGPGTASVLIAALDLGRSSSVRRRSGSGGDDGGYLTALADACRAGCASLPGYGAAHELLLVEAARARSLDIEHDRDPRRRLERMREFAATEYGNVTDTTCCESVAGSSSLLTTIAVLAVASDESATYGELRATVDAYTSAAIVSALLDNYVDQLDDPGVGAHNYLNYYPSSQLAVDRLAILIDRMMRQLGTLENAERHLVIACSMTAMFLSSDSARGIALAQDTKRLAASSGTLTRALIPVLRTWRVANRQSGG